jgi:hypothetical protein
MIISYKLGEERGEILGANRIIEAMHKEKEMQK